MNKRTKSSLNGMRAAIMTVEEVVKSRNQVRVLCVWLLGHRFAPPDTQLTPLPPQRTFTSISNLEAALKSFRRLLKGGYDTIPSYSAFKLLDDMDTKIGDVRVALEVGTEGLSKIAGEVRMGNEQSKQRSKRSDDFLPQFLLASLLPTRRTSPHLTPPHSSPISAGLPSRGCS